MDNFDAYQKCARAIAEVVMQFAEKKEDNGGNIGGHAVLAALMTNLCAAAACVDGFDKERLLATVGDFWDENQSIREAFQDA